MQYNQIPIVSIPIQSTMVTAPLTERLDGYPFIPPKQPLTVKTTFDQLNLTKRPRQKHKVICIKNTK